jgi:hypothetical protein
MLGISVRRQLKVERQHAALGRLGPGPARGVDAIGQDRGATAPDAEPHERGTEVPERSLAVGMTADAARERWIDEDRRRPNARRQQIVDQLGVVAGDSHAGEGGSKHLGAGRIDLVEDETRAGAPREGGEEAGAGRRFEHQVRGRNARRQCSEVGDRGRRRELLEFNLLFTAHRVGRKICNQLGECRQAGAGIGGKVGLREVQDLGEFEHVVGIAERPATIGGRSAIGLFHDPQQRVALQGSVPGDRVGDRLCSGNRRFDEIAFESCG